MLNHYFSTSGEGENICSLNADNCGGQKKNQVKYFRNRTTNQKVKARKKPFYHLYASKLFKLCLKQFQGIFINLKQNSFRHATIGQIYQLLTSHCLPNLESRSNLFTFLHTFCCCKLMFFYCTIFFLF